jgi:hypothetical protein
MIKTFMDCEDRGMVVDTCYGRVAVCQNMSIPLIPLHCETIRKNKKCPRGFK